MRILVAGIAGGIVMFVWTSIAHMALPLGEAGINEIPNESAVLSAMQGSIGDKTGLYIFPGLGVGKNISVTRPDFIFFRVWALATTQRARKRTRR